MASIRAHKYHQGRRTNYVFAVIVLGHRKATQSIGHSHVNIPQAPSRHNVPYTDTVLCSGKEHVDTIALQRLKAYYVFVRVLHEPRAKRPKVFPSVYIPHLHTPTACCEDWMPTSLWVVYKDHAVHTRFPRRLHSYGPRYCRAFVIPHLHISSNRC
jgi:hypothetical protein